MIEDNKYKDNLSFIVLRLIKIAYIFTDVEYLQIRLLFIEFGFFFHWLGDREVSGLVEAFIMEIEFYGEVRGSEIV